MHEPLFPEAKPVVIPESETFSEEDESEGTAKRVFVTILKWVVFLAVIVGAALFVWNLFFDGDGNGGLNDEDGEVFVMDSSEKIIGKEGGEVSLKNGASIRIPRGALDRDILIVLEKVGEGEITDLYHVKPDGLIFISPVTVAIPYHQENLTSQEVGEIQLFVGADEDALSEGKTTRMNSVKHTVSTDLRTF